MTCQERKINRKTLDEGRRKEKKERKKGSNEKKKDTGDNNCCREESVEEKIDEEKKRKEDKKTGRKEIRQTEMKDGEMIKREGETKEYDYGRMKE